MVLIGMPVESFTSIFKIIPFFPIIFEFLGEENQTLKLVVYLWVYKHCISFSVYKYRQKERKSTREGESSSIPKTTFVSPLWSSPVDFIVIGFSPFKT